MALQWLGWAPQQQRQQSNVGQSLMSSIGTMAQIKQGQDRLDLATELQGEQVKGLQQAREFDLSTQGLRKDILTENLAASTASRTASEVQTELNKLKLSYAPEEHDKAMQEFQARIAASERQGNLADVQITGAGLDNEIKQYALQQTKDAGLDSAWDKFYDEVGKELPDDDVSNITLQTTMDEAASTSDRSGYVGRRGYQAADKILRLTKEAGRKSPEALAAIKKELYADVEAYSKTAAKDMQFQKDLKGLQQQTGMAQARMLEKAYASGDPAQVAQVMAAQRGVSTPEKGPAISSLLGKTRPLAEAVSGAKAMAMKASNKERWDPNNKQMVAAAVGQLVALGMPELTAWDLITGELSIAKAVRMTPEDLQLASQASQGVAAAIGGRPPVQGRNLLDIPGQTIGAPR